MLPQQTIKQQCVLKIRCRRAILDGFAALAEVQPLRYSLLFLRREQARNAPAEVGGLADVRFAVFSAQQEDTARGGYLREGGLVLRRAKNNGVKFRHAVVHILAVCFNGGGRRSPWKGTGSFFAPPWQQLVSAAARIFAARRRNLLTF